MTYYDILEISEKASPEVVRMAYKALCKKYHPDVCQGDKRVAEEKMKKINEAYNTLSDESKRRQYDYSLNSQRRYQQNSYSEPRRESYYQPRRESYSPPRQESYAININDLLRKGFAALEGSNWLIADVLFSQVLNIDSKNAEAYLGKLMVELEVRTREGLKNCAYPFNDRENYKKAYALGDESLKNFLYKTIQYINKRNHDAECEEIYRDACDFMGWSKSIRDFEYVIAQLEKIRGYKDAAQKIERCYEKIAQIKSEQLAAQAAREKRKQELKELFNAKLPLFKKIAIVVVPVLIVAIVAATVIPKTGKDNRVVEDTSNTVQSDDVVEDNSTNQPEIDDNLESAPTDTPSNVENNTKSTESVSNQTPSKPSTNTSTSKPAVVSHESGCVFANGNYKDVLAKEEGTLDSCFASSMGEGACHSRYKDNLHIIYYYNENAQLTYLDEIQYDSPSHNYMVKEIAHSYDSAGNITGRYEFNYSSSGKFVSQFNYIYNSLGILIQKGEKRYDANGVENYDQVYHYDHNTGDLTSIFIAEYNSEGRRTGSVEYDLDGNVLGRYNF